MNYVKKYLACTIMTCILLSTATSFAMPWSDYMPNLGAYLPDRSTLQKAKEYAGSYISPAWQSAKAAAPHYASYAIPLGLTALGSSIGSYDPYIDDPSNLDSLKRALAITGSSLLPFLQYNKVNDKQASNLSKLGYVVSNTLLSTAAAVIPVLIKAYLDGNIDRITFKYLMDNITIASAQLMSMATSSLAAWHDSK